MSSEYSTWERALALRREGPRHRLLLRRHRRRSCTARVQPGARRWRSASFRSDVTVVVVGNEGERARHGLSLAVMNRSSCALAARRIVVSSGIPDTTASGTGTSEAASLRLVAVSVVVRPDGTSTVAAPTAFPCRWRRRGSPSSRATRCKDNRHGVLPPRRRASSVFRCGPARLPHRSAELGQSPLSLARPRRL